MVSYVVVSLEAWLSLWYTYECMGSSDDLQWSHNTAPSPSSGPHVHLSCLQAIRPCHWPLLPLVTLHLHIIDSLLSQFNCDIWLWNQDDHFSDRAFATLAFGMRRLGDIFHGEKQEFSPSNDTWPPYIPWCLTPPLIWAPPNFPWTLIGSSHYLKILVARSLKEGMLLHSPTLASSESHHTPLSFPLDFHIFWIMEPINFQPCLHL